MKCYCCNHEMDGRVCHYCSFKKAIATDESGENFNKKRGKDEKIKILENLIDFSIVSYNYCWNENQGDYNCTEEKLVISNGIDCNNKIVWLKRDFAQIENAIGKPKKISLFYKCFSKEKQVIFEITPVHVGDFWRFGIEIDDNLELNVVLGTEDHYAQTEHIPLDLNR